MNHSGDAAEQIVRMSLEGVEVAAKISGGAAKEIALLLMTAMKAKDKDGRGLKLKGKARMASMLKSGKALEIYSIQERDLKNFYQGAKQYGIVYCVLRNAKDSPDGLCDIMVKAEDAPKISRVSERFKFATVDKAKMESEIIAAKAEKAAVEQPAGTQPDAPDINDPDKLVDDLMGTPQGKDATEPSKAAKHKSTKEATDNRPLADGAPPNHNPSAPSSELKRSYAKDISSRPSVKEEIRAIKAGQKAKEAGAPAREDKANNALSSTKHQQPQRGKKSKSKKLKERT